MAAPAAAAITTIAAERRRVRHSSPAPISASTAIPVVPPAVLTAFMSTVIAGERAARNQLNPDRSSGPGPPESATPSTTAA
jgi:hypothetical protein